MKWKDDAILIAEDLPTLNEVGRNIMQGLASILVPGLLG